MAIRSLSPPCPCAAVRFVMAAGENATDGALGDVLFLPITRRSSYTGKYQLQNALLRFGASLDVDFVMRMDDDTLTRHFVKVPVNGDGDCWITSVLLNSVWLPITSVLLPPCAVLMPLRRGHRRHAA